ncbi:hypothetical protein ACFL2G_04075 [Candidatus Omnitrophota bacterium]
MLKKSFFLKFIPIYISIFFLLNAFAYAMPALRPVAIFSDAKKEGYDFNELSNEVLEELKKAGVSKTDDILVLHGSINPGFISDFLKKKNYSIYPRQISALHPDNQRDKTSSGMLTDDNYFSAVIVDFSTLADIDFKAIMKDFMAAYQMLQGGKPFIVLSEKKGYSKILKKVLNKLGFETSYAGNELLILAKKPKPEYVKLYNILPILYSIFLDTGSYSKLAIERKIKNKIIIYKLKSPDDFLGTMDIDKALSFLTETGILLIENEEYRMEQKLLDENCKKGREIFDYFLKVFDVRYETTTGWDFDIKEMNVDKGHYKKTLVWKIDSDVSIKNNFVMEYSIQILFKIYERILSIAL